MSGSLSWPNIYFCKLFYKQFYTYTCEHMHIIGNVCLRSVEYLYFLYEHALFRFMDSKRD